MSFNMVPSEGNDPSSIAYQASALPLSYEGNDMQIVNDLLTLNSDLFKLCLIITQFSHPVNLLD